jgi:putative transposase
MALRDWLCATPGERHRPPHATDRGIALFITAATVDRVRYLSERGRRDAYRDLLVDASGEFAMELVAWVVLPEHYHVVVVPQCAEAFGAWINKIHRTSSIQWNLEDGTPRRQCWYQYWDRSLWTAGDVASRINYIHYNPVKHGHVTDPSEWEWSSYREYLRREEEELLHALERFPAPRKLPSDDF